MISWLACSRGKNKENSLMTWIILKMCVAVLSMLLLVESQLQVGWIPILNFFLSWVLNVKISDSTVFFRLSQNVNILPFAEYVSSMWLSPVGISLIFISNCLLSTYYIFLVWLHLLPFVKLNAPEVPFTILLCNHIRAISEPRVRKIADLQERAWNIQDPQILLLIFSEGHHAPTEEWCFIYFPACSYPVSTVP